MGFNCLKASEPLRAGTLLFTTKSPSICWDVFRDLVPFVQFKKREKHPWRSVTFGKDKGF